MKNFILEQLLNQTESDSIRKRIVYDSYSISTNVIKNNKKLNRTERLIFLRIFKILKKKSRHENQTKIALRLKFLFEEGEKLNLFIYFNGQDYQRNNETGIFEHIDLPADVVDTFIKLSADFLKSIGLTDHYLNRYIDIYDGNYYLSKCYELTNLKDYILEASPAAIVQMNKRLKTLKKGFKLK